MILSNFVMTTVFLYCNRYNTDKDLKLKQCNQVKVGNTKVVKCSIQENKMLNFFVECISVCQEY